MVSTRETIRMSLDKNRQNDSAVWRGEKHLEHKVVGPESNLLVVTTQTSVTHGPKAQE